MSISFASPSARAAASDLTISVSPLGLIELADEEFEIHGPRITRYANHWAFYIGQHWAYKREPGEAQITFNYTRAFSDFSTNFTFGRGVFFSSPLETSAIVPSRINRVWTVDNDKESLLWDIGNQGSVSGDCFVKIAYEEPHLQPPKAVPGIQQRFIPGKVKILVINSSYSFPEWYPHDKDRLLRFKMKYKFWGTADDGTRQVFTYTEIISETWIEEYINDDLVNGRPNPVGEIPVVHIPNLTVSGSPWGRSDVDDVIPLNRQFNETATDVADMITYHAAPITVVTGAKISSLESGPRKMWAVPEGAEISNLVLDPGGVDAALNFLAFIKKGMHELTGVPEGALGDVQPISNTSGVALAIQYQSMMNRYRQKVINYAKGFKKINRFVLLTLALKEPLSFEWDETEDSELEQGQLRVLDPEDPLTYVTDVHWPPPLPVDTLVALNEIQVMMELGLESKKGALKRLGEEFPAEKLLELFRERVEDAKDDAALDLMRAQFAQAVLAETGMLPTPGGPVPGEQTPPPGGSGENGTGQSTEPTPPLPLQSPHAPDSATKQKLMTELTTRAYGTRVPVHRSTNTEED